MREIQMLIREVPRVQTIARLPTPYERKHYDKSYMQLWVAVAMIVTPVVVAGWWVV